MELYEGEIGDELTVFCGKTKNPEMFGHEICLRDVSRMPYLTPPNQRKLLEAMDGVLKHLAWYKLVCCDGWTPVGEVCRALEQDNFGQSVTCQVDKILIIQMGLFAQRQNKKFFQVLNHKGGWWLRTFLEQEKAPQEKEEDSWKQGKGPTSKSSAWQGAGGTKGKRTGSSRLLGRERKKDGPAKAGSGERAFSS